MCFDICTINIRVSIPGVAFHITLLRLNVSHVHFGLWRFHFIVAVLCKHGVMYEVVCRCCCSLMFEGCCSVADLCIFVMLWKTFRLCSVARGRHASKVHDSNTCRFRMHRSVADSGMRFVEIVQDSDVQRVAEMLLLSIFSKVGKMLAGLSSHRLRTQCFQHVVCRAVAGGVLAFIFCHHIGSAI